VLFKNLKIGRVQTQFRLEAFNAFNVVNLGLPDATIFNVGGVRNPTAGRITTTSTPGPPGAAWAERVLLGRATARTLRRQRPPSPQADGC
jgi:hypothetical protein